MSHEIKPLKCLVSPVKLRSDTGTVIFGLKYFKSIKDQENLLLKNLQLKIRGQNVGFLSRITIFVGKYGIHQRNGFEKDCSFKREFLTSRHQI